MIEQDLLYLKEQIVSEANMVKMMLDKCINGLIQKDITLLREVVELEDKVNNLELEIDKLCTNIIALYQPEAKHLRTVLMIYKINADLERMADHTVNITGSAEFLLPQTPLRVRSDIPEMYLVTMSMLVDSITAFNTEDVGLARNVCIRDNKVDDLNKHIISHLIEDVKSDTDVVERAFHVLRISKNLERIADLTTNVAEEVIYMVEGSVIKHNQ